jgi:S1-C subfamily serine protease
MVRIAATAIALAASLLGFSGHGSEPIQLLDFSTPICGPCRLMEPLIQAYQKAGYPIRKVDASQEREMAHRYGVTRVPCFVMLVEGQEVDRIVGPVDTHQLQKMFKQAHDVYLSRHRPRNAQPVSSVPDVSLAGSAAPKSSVDRGSRQEPDWTPDSTGAAGDSSPEMTTNLLSATVRIGVQDGPVRSFGTGTIIDAREGDALIITCGHLFRESGGRGTVQVELFEATSSGLRVVGQYSGEVIRHDLDRDVGLVSIRPDRPVAVAPIAARNAAVATGDRVVSIGCSNGQDPTVLASRITALDRYQGPPNIEASGAPAVGRSGGGLFNENGELIGVCYSADYEGNEGLYAPLESIHDELDRLRLTSETTNPLVADAGADRLPSSPRSNTSGGPIVRGQGGQDRQDETSIPAPPPERESAAIPAVSTIGPNNPPSPPPNNLNANERAALGEIMSRAAEYEVLVIVRPKEPGGESEVFTLDRVSSEFVRALAERQRGPQAPAAR